ncbi:MAG: hypothetical protein IJK78_16560 [Bacteroidales bacterium]|nr:hypothetical protein [Bacteroidales bacterium]
MKYWIALVFQVCMCAVPVMAQDTTSVSQRPKVGLVLAGGGARGASFIGVLKYLEELDIPIDYVVGLGARYYTEEGAALLFSMGLEVFVRQLHWSHWIDSTMVGYKPTNQFVFLNWV